MTTEIVGRTQPRRPGQPNAAARAGWLRRWIARRHADRDLLMLLPECIAIIGFIVVIWSGIALILSQQHQTAEREAVRDGDNLTRAFEENTERIVAGIDQILLSMRADYARNPLTFDLLDWQRHHTRTDRFTIQLGMAGPDGFVRGSSLGGAAAARIDVSDREHFRFHLDPTRDELFISKPVLGRGTGKWTVQFTRKLIGPGGSFAGILLLSLGCEELSEFYNTLDIGHGFVMLAGTDGIVRARGPLLEGVLGADITGQPAFIQSRTASHGSNWTTSRFDGTTRIVSFRRLPDLPLLVVVGFDTADVFQAYTQARTRFIWIGAITTGIVLLLGVLWISLRQRWIASRRLLRLTFETVSQGIVMVGADGQASVVNRRALQLLNLPAEMLQRPKAFAWPAPSAGGAARQPAGATSGPLSGGLRPTEAMTQIVREDGKVIEVRSHPTSAGGTVLTYTDITERKLAEARILHVAHHDSLTGLPNRLLLNERIDDAVEQAERRGGRFAIFGLDLDGFKIINDTMGHDAGDVVLCRFAERLRSLVRPGDTVARTGGDEFTILVRDLAQSESAEQVAQRLLDGLPMSVDLGGYAWIISSSIGIALYPEDGTDGRALLKNADTALYRAKAEEKGRFRRFEIWMDRSLAERRLLERELQVAIERNEIEVHFQPQFATDSLRVTGFEALVRWHHAERGMVPPGVFIPLAEECGLIVPIGRSVLEQVCALAAGWHPRCRVAVNLSPVQFHDSGLLPLLSSVLLRTGFPASLLELEVTEGVLIKDEELALGTLHALKDLGVHIALDDFGTGYSSLSYLRRFPFDGIKIDKCFVSAQEQDSGTRAILEAVLAMSNRLNLRVTAEGVETEEQLAMLRDQGCAEVQGFLLGRPMPADEVQDFLRSVTAGAGRGGRHLRLAASNPLVVSHRAAETSAGPARVPLTG